MNRRASAHSPERLNALIAGGLSEDPIPAVREIEREGLWEYVASHAWQTRVGGLLLDRLRTRGIAVPESAAGQLEAYRDHVTAANAYNLERIEPALARLQDAGVPFLVLKGAALNAIQIAEKLL